MSTQRLSWRLQRYFMRLKWRMSVGLSNYLLVLVVWAALVVFSAALTIRLLAPTLAP